MVERILIVDDDVDGRNTISTILQKEGYESLVAESGKEAVDKLQTGDVDVLITDLRMPGMDGLELLDRAKVINKNIPVIIVTGSGTVETAVEAMKAGAYDYLIRPFRKSDITTLVKNALKFRAVLLENLNLKQQLQAEREKRFVVGVSAAMKHVLDMVEQVAPSTSTVLLLGETGTGKEVVALAIHKHSPRAAKPFIKVSCAALPETLLENELFGHEKGAYTGATSTQRGRFELADGGTIFLDEIGEMTLATQVKLLAVLQEGHFERIGGTKTIAADVRVIAASNRDLAKAVEQRTFREDLYYRLNVINIHVPPLRDRPEDIPILASYFARKYAESNDKKIEGISGEAMNALSAYMWPGNVRELENAIERAVVMAKQSTISAEDLPPSVRAGASPVERSDHIAFNVGSSMAAIEKEAIIRTLERAKGDKKLAADILKIGFRTLYRRLKEYGLLDTPAKSR
jgi:two-component system response regulator HydG